MGPMPRSLWWRQPLDPSRGGVRRVATGPIGPDGHGGAVTSPLGPADYAGAGWTGLPVQGGTRVPTGPAEHRRWVGRGLPLRSTRAGLTDWMKWNTV